MTLVKRNNPDFFPSMLDDFFKTDWLGGVSNLVTNNPAVNIIEKDDLFEIEVAAPGFTKKDFEVDVDNEVLTIAATAQEQKEGETNYARREFNYNSFKRTFTLSDAINSAAIKGDYKNGILTVTLPKREEAKAQPKRLIKIA